MKITLKELPSYTYPILPSLDCQFTDIVHSWSSSGKNKNGFHNKATLVLQCLPNLPLIKSL